MALSGVLAPHQPLFSQEPHASPSCPPDHLSPPRQFPTDVTSPILEEGGESESETPNEPVTPVSRRPSQEFTPLPIQPQDNPDSNLQPNIPPANPRSSSASKPPLLVNTAATPSPRPEDAVSTPRPPPTPITAADQEPPQTPLSRRSTRGSAGGFRRTVSSIFRRTNSQSGKQDFALADSSTAPASDTSLNGTAQPKSLGRRFSMNKSSATTRSNSPPSPGSPLEMAAHAQDSSADPTIPTTEDFKKKNRASTGFSLRGRAVNFANGTTLRDSKRPKQRRRASSFDATNSGITPSAAADPRNPTIPERVPWPLPAEAGTGVKARRMSLSLPDDFTVDVAQLLNEFEYQNKLFGRHRHLGRGATSKVQLMVRKGCPGELYAVKEFRGKSRSETKNEYEKKVKSEYSIAKSLHHPNIVETIRLCTDDHGRWNHVMEYCSEGDLYGLVQKGYLKQEGRLTDRLCLFKQLVQGVNYLHANGIAHRDIKLENLLVTKDSKLKITDFGVSEVFSGIHPGLREAGGQCGRNMGNVRLCAPGICGSLPYMAPEVLNKEGEYDPRPLDVWSSAIIMIYLTFGGAIWDKAAKGQANYDSLAKGWDKWNAKHVDADDEALTDTDYPTVPAFDAFVKPPALRRVLLQMLNPNPAKRITIAEVVSNRWMKNVECCQLESYEDPTKTIDASKKGCAKSGAKKIYCHNHLPPKEHKMGTLPKMPQYTGY